MSPAALVTGGAVRLGRAIAERLAEAGYDLALHYRHSRAQAEQAAEELREQHGVKVVLVAAELAQADDVRRMAEAAIVELEGLDLLVNSAAAFYPTRTLAESEAAWDEMHQTNLRAPFVAAVACADALRDRRGAIVNLADIYAMHPLKGYLSYSVAKAGVVALTRALALELAPGVRVNAVAPGAILLPTGAGPDKADALARDIPLGRMGEPRDIADAVLYLATAPFVTGQVLAVDGGRSIAL